MLPVATSTPSTTGAPKLVTTTPSIAAIHGAPSSRAGVLVLVRYLAWRVMRGGLMAPQAYEQPQHRHAR
jgi:hypothetical protein